MSLNKLIKVMGIKINQSNGYKKNIKKVSSVFVPADKHFKEIKMFDPTFSYIETLFRHFYLLHYILYWTVWGFLYFR